MQLKDRASEVDFLVDSGGRLELFEPKWTEIRAGGRRRQPVITMCRGVPVPT